MVLARFVKASLKRMSAEQEGYMGWTAEGHWLDLAVPDLHAYVSCSLCS